MVSEIRILNIQKLISLFQTQDQQIYNQCDTVTVMDLKIKLLPHSEAISLVWSK